MFRAPLLTISVAGVWSSRLSLAAALMLSTAAIAAPDTSVAGQPDCAVRYHAALGTIRADAFAAIKPARTIAFKGDETLPEGPIFRPLGKQADRAEAKALAEAAAIARNRGRANWVGSANDRWIADRIVSDLGEYVSQDLSPYLCGGVPEYLATLKSYMDRIATSPSKAAEHLTVQFDATAASIRSAMIAMGPVPLPRFAPPLRNHPLVFDLRRSKGIERPASTEAFGPQFDPALPPLAMAEARPPALASDDDRLAILDRLVDTARTNGFLGSDSVVATKAVEHAPVSETPAKIDPGTTGSIDRPATVRPVLARLAALKPLVVGQSALISDALVRRALTDAFADIEALDHLAHRPSGGYDPMLAAIAATMDAIALAHADACGCADAKPAGSAARDTAPR